jgi:hypothetical protein
MNAAIDTPDQLADQVPVEQVHHPRAIRHAATADPVPPGPARGTSQDPAWLG